MNQAIVYRVLERGIVLKEDLPYYLVRGLHRLLDWVETVKNR